MATKLTDRNGQSLDMKQRKLRLTDEESDKLDKALRLSPYHTMRDLITSLVDEYLNNKEKELGGK